MTPSAPSFVRYLSDCPLPASPIAIPLDGTLPNRVTEHEKALPEWSFLVGKAAALPGDDRFGGLCGWVGRERYGSPPDSAFPMKEAVPEEALFAFLLTCGLSAVEAAGLEIGDTAVITGSGSLAQSILAAALLQGACCVSFASQRREGELFETPGKQVRAAVLRAEELRAANPPSQRFVMWETTGEPEILDLLVPQLGPRGKLILCRGDKNCAAQLNCYRDLHKTSAVIESWNPASPAMLPSWRDCYRRAACLIQYKRVLKGRAWQASP